MLVEKLAQAQEPVQVQDLNFDFVVDPYKKELTTEIISPRTPLLTKLNFIC